MGIYVYKMCSKSEALKNRVEGFNVDKNITIAYYKYADKLDYSFLGGYENNDKIYNKIIRFFKMSWKDDIPDYIVYFNKLYKVNKKRWKEYNNISNGYFTGIYFDDEFPSIFFGEDKLFTLQY